MRVRIRFAKEGKVRFTSHRDVARMWERGLRRAGLAVAQTGGFRPRPKLSFGLALSTGHESTAEYLDVELAVPLGGAELLELPARLSPELPVGVDVQAAAALEPGSPSLQESVRSCTWRIEALDLSVADAHGLVDQALAAQTLVVTRQRKGREVVDDLRPAVLSVSVTGPTPTGTELEAELAVHPRSVRPAELLAALDPALAEGRVRRVAQWTWRAPECVGSRWPPPQASTRRRPRPPKRVPPEGTTPMIEPVAEVPGSSLSSTDDSTSPELPERLSENTPSPEAAAQALVPHKPKIGDTLPAPPPRTRRRRRTRGRDGGGGGETDGRGDPSGGAAGTLDDETLEQRRGRERHGRPVGRYLMCVHVSQRSTQIAVLEGRLLIEHYVAHDDDSQIHGNIYLGRVQNVLPGMEAAFLDIGTPKNGVLYRSDVQYDAEDIEESGPARIEHILRPRQAVICQVTKNPIGQKGARLTQEMSLPGRFVVLIPGSSTYGISKRLFDDERKRLRAILDEIKPADHGIIVRTAASGATAGELQRDIGHLTRQWEAIEAEARTARAPALLHREPNMAVRVIREEFNPAYRGVVIDDDRLFREVHGYVSAIAPELSDRVEHYDPAAEALPLFERHHVHEQLHKALDRKVWLSSGGSLVIERTEALTVIDVNTGRNVGRTSLEETVYRNNLEAAEEIARQLRLRDIGGIIVVDFIDMEVKSNRDDLTRVFREALSRDKTRTQVFEVSELGLVQMTRKRIGEGLLESLSTPCPSCEGRGILIDESLE